MLRRFVLLAYRTGLFLYPRRVRLNHGAEMVSAVEAEWHRRAGGGARGTFAFIIWLVFDVVRSLPSHYVAPIARRLRNRSRRGRGSKRMTHLGWRDRMHTVSQQLRHSTRTLMRNPGFTATAAIATAISRIREPRRRASSGTWLHHERVGPLHRGIFLLQGEQPNARRPRHPSVPIRRVDR